MSTQPQSLRDRALAAAREEREVAERADREREERHALEALEAFETSLRALLDATYNPHALAEMRSEQGEVWFRYTDEASGLIFTPVRLYSLAVFHPCARCGNGLLREFGFGRADISFNWLAELGRIIELSEAGTLEHRYDDPCPAREVAKENARRIVAEHIAALNTKAQERTLAEDLVQALRAALGL